MSPIRPWKTIYLLPFILLLTLQNSQAMDFQRHELDFQDIYVIKLSQDEYHAALYDVGSPKRFDAAIRGLLKPHIILINAGYFDERFRPVGGFYINGKRIMRSKRASLLSGVVAIDHSGKLDILSKKDPVDHPSYIQTGPFLIDPGGRVGIKSDNGRRARRTILARNIRDHIYIISTGRLGLMQLANYLLKKYPDIERAINLDGGPSSGLWVKHENHEISVPSEVPVRGLFLFSLKKK